MASSMQHLQPHSGIQGKSLGEGHLLSLDDESVARRMEVLHRTWQRWRDILHGRLPDRDALFNCMYDPQIGDLVVEITTGSRRSGEDLVQASGILLVSGRKEWASSDEQWAQAVAEEKAAHEKAGIPFDADRFAGERFTDTAHYIQYGPDPQDVCRWVNCKFIAIPEDLLADAH